MIAPMDCKGRKKALSAALLLIASLIWGVAFVAQAKGMDHIGPFTFSAVRAYLAGLTLLPCCKLFDRLGLSPRTDRRETWKAGLTLGVILFVAGNLQQLGLMGTSVAKAGFITSLYIVLVPVAGLLFRRRVHPMLWVCVLLAVCGLYFLSIHGDFAISGGDVLVLCCAVAFTAHIFAIDYFAARADVLRMSCIQFFVFGTLSLVPMIALERPTWQSIAAAWLPLAYAGVFSGGFAYTMQMLGQRNIEPAAASLLLSPEAVFAALAGWILMGQTLTSRELLGCALVLAGVVLSQLPWSRIFARKHPAAAMPAIPAPVRLETERLYLRELTQADYGALIKILGDSAVMYAYERAFDDAETQAWLDKQTARYRAYGFGLWAVMLRETDEMIGQCGLTMQECGGDQVLEIGYLFQKEFWHRGYATEAAIACKNYAFDVLKAGKVYSIVRDTNLASQRVALRNGMRLENSFIKHYRGVDMPHLVYAVARET